MHVNQVFFLYAYVSSHVYKGIIVSAPLGHAFGGMYMYLMLFKTLTARVLLSLKILGYKQ